MEDVFNTSNTHEKGIISKKLKFLSRRFSNPTKVIAACPNNRHDAPSAVSLPARACSYYDGIS